MRAVNTQQKQNQEKSFGKRPANSYKKDEPIRESRAMSREWAEFMVSGYRRTPSFMND